MELQRLPKLWEMEHWRPRTHRPSSVERERRISQQQRAKFDRDERVRGIHYPVMVYAPHQRTRVTTPYVSPALLEHTYASQAKSRAGNLTSHRINRSYSADDLGSPRRRSPSPRGHRPSSPGALRAPRYTSDQTYTPHLETPHYVDSRDMYRARRLPRDSEDGIIPSIMQRHAVYANETQYSADRHLMYTSWGASYLGHDDGIRSPAGSQDEGSVTRAYRSDRPSRMYYDDYDQGIRRGRSSSPYRASPRRTAHSPPQRTSGGVRTNRTQQLREHQLQVKRAKAQRRW